MDDVRQEYREKDTEDLDDLKKDLDELRMERREEIKARPARSKARVVAESLNRQEICVSIHAICAFSSVCLTFCYSLTRFLRTRAKFRLSFPFVSILTAPPNPYCMPHTVYTAFLRRDVENLSPAFLTRREFMPCGAWVRKRLVCLFVRGWSLKVECLPNLYRFFRDGGGSEVKKDGTNSPEDIHFAEA